MPEIISYDKLSYVPKLLATTFGHPTMKWGRVVYVCEVSHLDSRVVWWGWQKYMYTAVRWGWHCEADSVWCQVAWLPLG